MSFALGNITVKSVHISTLTLYITSVGLAGFCLNIFGLWTIAPAANTPLLWLHIGLAVVAAATTTSVNISKETGLTYHVTPAISLAAVPVFGPFAAVLISSSAGIAGWIIKQREPNWKGSWRQLGFNLGMDSIAIYISSMAIYLFSRSLDEPSIWAQLLIWLVAAVLFEQINLWLLIGIMRLQHGPDFGLWAMWREEQWATRLDILVTALGGAILAYAGIAYEWRGVLTFFLPILLSAYAFRLYTSKMQSYMENLEEIVSQRTAELAQRTDELAEINRQKDTFLTVLTHDMITPLTSIRMCTEMLDKKASNMPEIAPVTDLIMRNQRSLINLAHNIMDIEKLQTGIPVYLEKEPLEIGAQIQEAIAMMQPEAQAKQVELSYEIGDSPIIIMADRHQMQRILLNLISNAIKYTPEDGIACVSAGLSGDHFLLEVEDTGYGISPEELPEIFQRFMRASQMRGKVAGTGIGLAVVKALVDAHEGNIDVASTLDAGTKFTITMPTGMNA